MPPTLLLVSQPGDAGVAHVAGDHVAWARQAGWDVVVACEEASRLAELVRDGGGRVAHWRASRNPGPSLPGEVLRLHRIVRRTRPSVVHLHSSKAGLAGRLAVRGRLPTVFQPHAWSFEAASGVLGTLSAAWERFAVRWAHVVVCVSEAERTRGRRAGIDAPVVVLRNAVDVTRFRPSDPLEVRQRLLPLRGLGPTVPVAVCVGRLARQKGQDLLLEAWSLVAAELPQAVLVLVGDGPDHDALRAVAPPGVRFIGSVTDPVPWFQAADVVVLPSRWEGQALVLLEAMACGRSVVTSDIEANTSTLPAGAGTAVPVDDARQLARALVERLSPESLADRRREGATGRRHVEAHHSPRGAAQDLVRLYAWLRLARVGG